MVSVLVADDDPGIREVVALALEDEGYAVTTVADGETLLASLRSLSGRFVVLLDRLMPKMGGLEVLAVVAEDSHLREHHAYALSTAASASLTSEQRALLASVNAPVLPKPFDLEQLFTVVAELAARIAPPTSQERNAY